MHRSAAPSARHQRQHRRAGPHEAYVTPSTLAPTDARVRRETEQFLATARAAGHTPEIISRDRDGKFGKGFRTALSGAGVRAILLPHRSPNLNAHTERFIRTLRSECLDRFIVLGTGHLDRLAREYLDY